MSEYLFNNGVAIGVLIAVGMASWRITVWLGNRVILPVVQRHINYMDDLAFTMKQNSTVLNQNSEVLNKLVEKIK